MNEFIFFVHTIILACAAIGAWYLGKEALFIFVSFTYVIANFFITKQIGIFFTNATATDAFIIGGAIGLNLLNEFYGKTEARKALYFSLLSAIFFLLLSIIHLLYLPSSFDIFHPHFYALLMPIPRIIIASLCSYGISQTVEYQLYALLKKRFGQDYLVARNWITLSISQLLDTVLFSFLGLYGILDNIISIIIVSYTIKLITILLMSPFLWVIKKYRKNRN